MHIVISNTSDLPIYAQIKEQVKEQILSGELEEDEMLPSLRQLAKDLKISVLTTTRAYNELEEEGFSKGFENKCIDYYASLQRVRGRRLYYKSSR